MSRYGRDDTKTIDVGVRLFLINQISKMVKKSSEYLASSNMFRDQTDVIRVDLNRIDTDELDIIHEYLKTVYGDIEIFKKLRNEYVQNEPHNWLLEYDTIQKELNVIFQMISVIKKSRNKPESQTYTRLDHLAIGIKNFLMSHTYKHCLIDKENNLYLVSEITYKPAERDYPAYCQVDMAYMYAGERSTTHMTFHSDDIRDTPVASLLERSGYLIVTEKDWQQYEEYYQIYRKYTVQIGKQFTSIGNARTSDGYHSRQYICLEKHGAPSKLVVDEDEKKLPSRMIVGNERFWGGNEDIEIPYHAYVQMYDLTSYRQVRSHVKDLVEYVYDKTLIDKLILPEDTSNILDILLGGVQDLEDDIIQGKSGGIIVISTGLPGIGKTLTAEVYAEIVEKPLYKVQSAQLGISADTVEKRLQECLRNAEKWDAILLIDECDVYLRNRGDDLEHNALVGVFLRVLEYFSGLLFLTSNRDEMIDDAIYSRKTAHIKYKMPTPSELARIWEVHLTQQRIEHDQAVIDKIVKAFPNASGRDVKSLSKLGKLIMNRKKETKLTLETIIYAAPFVGVVKEEETKK